MNPWSSFKCRCSRPGPFQGVHMTFRSIRDLLPLLCLQTNPRKIYSSLLVFPSMIHWHSFRRAKQSVKLVVVFPLVLDPLSSPSRWLERIGKVLCLADNLAIAKLHNADCLR